MKFPQQLLFKFTGLFEEPPLRTPASPLPPEAVPVVHRRTGPDETLTHHARQLVRSLRGMSDLAEKVRVVWNPRLQTTAGTANSRHWQIDLNPRLDEHGSAVIHRILRHELAHLVSVHRAGRRKISAHGPEWRKACEDLGIGGESRCHSLPFKGRRVTPKYAYRCQHCGRLLRRVKILERRSACYDCCRTHNRGRYDERFRYVRVPLDVLEDAEVQAG